jgi:hypothetical protein
MMTTIRDPRALHSIRPLDLRTYLEGKSWVLKAAASDFGAAWVLRRPGAKTVEVLVPATTEIDDYATRISDLLSTLESVERRSQTEILVDVANALADVIRVRSADEDTADGTILLEDGVRLIKSARDMVLDAASSAKDPKPIYPNRRSDEVAAFIERSRLGQSERGSYVITLISRLTPPANGQLLPGLHDPFERIATRTLAEALDTIRRGADHALSTGEIAPLTQAYRQGVSANLCDAVVEMSGPKQHLLEIRFSWSPAYTIPDDAIHQVEIRPEHIPIIEEAARRLRDNAPLEDFQLVGVVIGLQRAEGEAIGRVTVLGFVEGRPRRVYLELGSTEYGEAGRAHIDRIPVNCVGELVKLNRAYILRNIRSFVVVAPTDTLNGE